MELGLGALGVPPSVFWSMTPREFEAALRGRFGNPADAGALSRRDLYALMQRFPDAEMMNHGND